MQIYFSLSFVVFLLKNKKKKSSKIHIKKFILNPNKKNKKKKKKIKNKKKHSRYRPIAPSLNAFTVINCNNTTQHNVQQQDSSNWNNNKEQFFVHDLELVKDCNDRVKESGYRECCQREEPRVYILFSFLFFFLFFSTITLLPLTIW